MTRHVLHALGWRRNLPHLRAGSRRDRFAQIYAAGYWKLGNPDMPGSGTGSTLAATETLRAELPKLLARCGARSLLDVGCGDFTWMKNLTLPCRYFGIDIVASVVAANQAAYGSRDRRFAVRDAVTDELPEGDVVLCREVLFHLSLDDAKNALCNMLAGERRYLLATTDRETNFNADIVTGDFRVLNLERRPFRFPPPLFEIPDAAGAPGRVIGLWKIADIKDRVRGGTAGTPAARLLRGSAEGRD
jgi:SAM-dependent methyltransferase